MKERHDRPDGTSRPMKPSPRNPNLRLRGSNFGLGPISGVPFAPPQDPPISAPDIALQFVPCLETISAPGIDLKAEVIAAIQSAIPGSGDVLYQCVDGSGCIGIWMSPKGNDQVEAARTAGLGAISLLDGEAGNFAIWVNASFIRSRAVSAFNTVPKRTNEDGTSNPTGPVHLTGVSIDFVSPNSIVTEITGYDETPWPDVSFTLSISDTFSVSGSQVHVQSGTSLDVDQSFIDLLLGISAILATFVSPAFYFAVLGFVAEGAIIVSTEPGNFGGGAGAAAAQNIPTDILIPQGQKIVFKYNGVAIDAGGMTAFAQMLLMARTPGLTMVGPRQISVDPGSSQVTRAFQVDTYDLLSPVKVSWTGAVTATPPNGRYTSATFDYSGLAPGGSLSRELRATATDADGLSAETTVFVEIFMTKTGANIPPECLTKPWLPQCR
ncbi:MAG: hypothetical protein WBD69_05885 [Candidatus Cybelea sp.]